MLLLLTILLLACAGQAGAAAIPMIDAHSQIDHEVDPSTIIRLMDQGGVSRTILSFRGRVTPDLLAELASKHPARITPAVRTKGYMDQARYYELLKRQVENARFAAMGEVLLYHARKGKRAPEVIYYPDNEKVQAALNYAVNKRWPFIAHIEFEAAGQRRDRLMAGLKQLLAQHPRHPVVLIHTAQLRDKAAAELLAAHENLYIIPSHSDPITLSKSSQPWTNLFDGERLSEEWKRLILKYPDRFILGFDMVWPEDWGQFYLDKIALWRSAVEELPSEAARALAHKNAERLWSLPPTQ